MKWLSQVRRRLRFLFHRERFDSDLEEEMKSHLEMQAEENEESGMPPKEARYAARRRFGNPTLLREQTRDIWGWRWLEELGRDVRYALRALRNNPGWSFVIVLTLALGIGANTAIFSLINTVLLKPLPVDSPEELFFVTSRTTWRNTSFSYPLFQDLREIASEVAELFATGGGDAWEVRFVNPAGDGVPERVMGELVSGAFFTGLGVDAAVGRVLLPEDARQMGGHPVAVLSHRFWTRRFGNDPTVLGRRFVIHQTAFMVVGVAETGFFGINPGTAPDIWIPMVMQSQVSPGASSLDSYNLGWVNVMGRLKSGVSREQAAAALSVRYRQFVENQAATITDTRIRESVLNQRLELVDGRAGFDFLSRRYSKPLQLLMAAVGLVLLITCANVASLLLARATARQRETSVRLALGASRGRLIRQWLTESLLLAGLAALLGFGLAYAGARALINLVSLGQAGLVLNVSPNLRLLAFTAVVAALAAILFGLAPALRISWSDVRGALASTTVSVCSGQAGLTTRRTLVGLQIALSLILAVGAGLLLRTVYNLYTLDSGFDRKNVLSVMMAPRDAGYSLPIWGDLGEDEIRVARSKLTALYSELYTRFEAMSGVESASWSQCGLLTGCRMARGSVRVEGYTPTPDEDSVIRCNWVGPRYFKTTGTELLAGRDFTLRDNISGPLVAVINETSARHYFGDGNPIGKHLSFNDDPERYEIIGVVRDAHYNGPREETPRFIYFSQLQEPSENAAFVFRTQGEPRALTEQITQIFKDVDSSLSATAVTTLDERMAQAIAQERLLAQLTTVFGLLALAVTCVGLYGLMAYSIAQRTNEIGVRMALGANKGAVIRYILAQGMTPVVMGLAVGIAGALLATKVLRTMLFGISPTDPMTFAFAVLLLIIVALTACCIPARRATRIDPMEALRYE